MIRLFVGLALPEETRDRLAALERPIPGARWTPSENLHLTLRFIGPVDEAAATDVDAELSRIDAAGFELTLTGVDYFASRSRARVLWVGTKASDGLLELQGKIERAVQRSGLAPERRKFHAHVTLARLRDVRVDRVVPFVAAHADFRAGPLLIDRFILYSSSLGRSGSIYTEEVAYGLNASGPTPGTTRADNDLDATTR